MGQSCSGSKQQLSSSYQYVILDSSSSSSNRGTFSSTAVKESKQFKPYKQTGTPAIVRGYIGKITHELRGVTYEKDPQPSSTINARSSTNSTDDDQRSIVVLAREFPSHHNSSPSPSSSQSCNSLHQQGEISIAQTYQILPQITGHGAAGQVRKCIHHQTFQLCAVKTIPKNRIQQKDRIYREIAFLKQANHPNIVSLYDVYEDENEVHIVTEICHGGELFDKIIENAAMSKTKRTCAGGNKRAVPSCFHEKDAARIIHSLLSAVSYLHSKDIVHRDIKPENILFSEKDNDESPIKLIDFGLSIRHPRQFKPLTATVGTAYYMSPELLEGSYDRSCDLWSIGVVAYVMLSGRPPFNGPSNDIIFKKIRRGQYTMDDSSLWDGVSKSAKNFIRCLLIIDPRRRWTADMALGHPWLKMAKLDAELR